jgi:disulfide bond formation protein DsbB
MTLDQFSTVLVAGSIALFAVSVGGLILSLVSSRVFEHLKSHGYEQFLWVLLIISGLSVAGTIVYQLVYLTPVCELCWWQRIFLYPIPLITAVALWCKSRTAEAHVTVAVLAVLGLWYASYHYYYHFQKYVLGNELGLPCSYGGLMPACTDSPILIFGFATIPFLGIMVFGSILALAVILNRLLKTGN